MLLDCELTNKVKGMRFDITILNSGELNKDLRKIYYDFPVAIHMLETILEAIVACAIQASSAPDI